MAAGEFELLLQDSTMPLCLPRQKLMNLDLGTAKEDIVLFTYPLFTDYLKHEGTALFYVKSASINELLSQKLQRYQTQIYIPVLPDKITIGQENYVVRSHRSSLNQWSYFAFIPNKQTTFSQVTSMW